MDTSLTPSGEKKNLLKKPVVAFLVNPQPFCGNPKFYSHLPAYEDGTDRVFRNVGI